MLFVVGMLPRTEKNQYLWNCSIFNIENISNGLHFHLQSDKNDLIWANEAQQESLKTMGVWVLIFSGIILVDAKKRIYECTLNP